VCIIDQRFLPHEFVVERMTSVEEVCRAISEMRVRGAGLIGAAAGYGIYLATRNAHPHRIKEDLEKAAQQLISTRPTARNLAWAVERQLDELSSCETLDECQSRSLATARCIADEDASFCQRIGEHGKKIIEEIAAKKSGKPVNILTHCNAGWLAFVDYGSATAPIYAAHAAGIPVHVWVDETRPWLQGARLTAWELSQQGVPCTLISDNTGGHLMQHGMVDLVLVGTDRTTRRGDVANKIGTYLKALAAFDNHIPFYVALPSSTFDWSITDGLHSIPIEQRGADEVLYVAGKTDRGEMERVLIAQEGTPCANYGFDVTPARLISGLITERGITPAREADILSLYPEFA